MASGTARVTIPIGSWRGVARPQYGDLDVGRKGITGYVRQVCKFFFGVREGFIRLPPAAACGEAGHGGPSPKLSWATRRLILPSVALRVASLLRPLRARSITVVPIV